MSIHNIFSKVDEGMIARWNSSVKGDAIGQGESTRRRKTAGNTIGDNSGDNSGCASKQKATNATHLGNSTEETKEETVSSMDESPPIPTTQMPFPEQTALERLVETASQAMGSIVKSASAQTKRVGSFSFMGDSIIDNNSTPRSTKDIISAFLDEACSPCSPSDSQPCSSDFFSSREQPRRSSTGTLHGSVAGEPTVNQLGIAPIDIPDQDYVIQHVLSSESVSTPVKRRQQRYMEKQAIFSECNEMNLPFLAKSKLPIQSLTVSCGDAIELEHSISELTMKSSHGGAKSRITESRRMAYYAVGKHHKNSGRGGNRRCYFTGKLILGGAPFYAGSVQQGLRTLVVFCMPSAVGLPKGNEVRRQSSPEALPIEIGHSARVLAGETLNLEPIYGTSGLPRPLKPDSLLKRSRSRSLGANSATGSASRLSSLDDTSLILEEDLDPNWGLDRDFLLAVLPEPSQDLLHEMSSRYPEQFETLPIQVRSPHCWRLFIKFCFFSGLPIAEGELYYKVKDEVASEVYGEEIILSHDVMEAVNGESADILRLPNLKTYRYLRKHYTQQSGKLSDVIFKRTSWEVVLPEV